MHVVNSRQQIGPLRHFNQRTQEVFVVYLPPHTLVSFHIQYVKRIIKKELCLLHHKLHSRSR